MLVKCIDYHLILKSNMYRAAIGLVGAIAPAFFQISKRKSYKYYIFSSSHLKEHTENKSHEFSIAILKKSTKIKQMLSLLWKVCPIDSI